MFAERIRKKIVSQEYLGILFLISLSFFSVKMNSIEEF